jgi:hypothetical protein
MASLVIIVLHDGTMVRGLNHRMDPAFPANPSVPNSYTNGQYHIETAGGWIDVEGSQVASTLILGGRPT